MKEKILKFLVDAKKQTYANENVKKLDSSRRGSSDYEYSDGEMIYHDTYFGGLSFMGEEVVYINNDVPCWGMNYYGITLDTNLSEDAIDKALRPALMMVGSFDDIIPVRGPKEYKNGDYKYVFEVNGDIENFDGLERIYKDDIIVYELRCHGGFII